MSCGEKLSEHWRKFRKDGFLYMLFVEPKREKLRFRKRRCRITDIFLYSNSSDYFVLRLLYNFPIGIALALLVYNLAWYKINFAEDTTLLPTWSGELVKWFIVSCAALTFTLNPLIRCSLILSLASVAASTGQGIISMYVLENAAQGPIRNVMKNFRISTRITICHLKIQAGITKRRIELQAGPLEAVFEKHFGNATSIGKKVIKTLRSLIQPFDDDMEEHSTEEDDQLSAIIDSAKVLADRQLKSLGAEKSEDDGGGAGPGDEQKIDKAAEPAWKRLKSKLGRAIAHRFTRRCQVMFAGSVTSCHKKFEESQSLCYDTVPFPVGYFTCARMNARDLCQPGKIGSISHRFCELGEKVDPSRGEHETLFSSELDQEMNGLQNVSKQIERQLQLNMHFQAVEAPEIERGFALSQLYAEVKHDVNVFEIILDTVRKVFSFLIVMFTYFVFRSAVETTLKYLNDIEYKNYFTTRYFWRIDSVRKGQQRTNLNPLRKEEKKHNKICTAFGCPRGDEVQKLIKSFVRWSVVVFIAVVIVMLDHYFHRMLQIIVENGNVTRIQKGHSRLNIVVNGSGAIAELLRNVMNMNYTSNLDDAVNNAECLFAPSAPDWGFNTRHIIIPLVLMVLLQVFFNVVIQRLVLFYVLGLMFPRRAKSRIIHLYNKILIGRVNLDRLEEADKLEGKKKDA